MPLTSYRLRNGRIVDARTQRMRHFAHYKQTINVNTASASTVPHTRQCLYHFKLYVLFNKRTHDTLLKEPMRIGLNSKQTILLHKSHELFSLNSLFSFEKSFRLSYDRIGFDTEFFYKITFTTQYLSGRECLMAISSPYVIFFSCNIELINIFQACAQRSFSCNSITSLHLLNVMYVTFSHLSRNWKH